MKRLSICRDSDIVSVKKLSAKGGVLLCEAQRTPLFARRTQTGILKSRALCFMAKESEDTLLCCK